MSTDETNRLSLPGRPSIAFASTALVTTLEKEVLHILRALKFSEGLIRNAMIVTDETRLADLGLPYSLLLSASEALGVPVREEDLVIEVAFRLRTAATP